MTLEPGNAARAAGQRVAAMLQRAQAMQAEGQRRDPALRVPLVRFALALVRQRLLPALEPHWLDRDPPHVAIFGGTNSGKSTLLNLLLGRSAAGMSFRARYSQHPEAFYPRRLGLGYLDDYPTRFADYERFVGTRPPRQSDAELRTQGYRAAISLVELDALPAPTLAPALSAEAVFWDMPDFSTEEAQAYMGAVLDTAALADLVLVAVTKENYADHRGGLLRSLVAATGARCRVIANKLEDGSHLLADICDKLAAEGTAAHIPHERIHPLPHVRGDDELTRLQLLLAHPQTAQLRGDLEADLRDRRGLKRAALAGGLDFLDAHWDELLAPLLAEANVGLEWARAVDRLARQEFFERYRRDYLDGRDYSDFSLAVVKLLDLLEVPGIGTVVSIVSTAIKQPFQWMMSGLRSLIGTQQEPPKPPEEEVVIAAYERWLAALKAEAQEQAQATGHPAWRDVTARLDSSRFLLSLEERLAQAYIRYRDEMTRLIDQRANELYQYVEERPLLRHTLQGSKTLADLLSAVAVVKMGGMDLSPMLLYPAVAPLVRFVLEQVGEGFMELQKEALKREQLEALKSVLETEMLAPMRELFQAGVSGDEIAAARRDWQTLREALRGVGAAIPS